MNLNRRGFIAGISSVIAGLMPGWARSESRPTCGPDCANQTGYQIIITPAPNGFKAGDVITIGGVKAYNRATKQTTGRLRQFVVTSETPIGGRVLSIYPAIIPIGPYPFDPDGWYATVEKCAAAFAPIEVCGNNLVRDYDRVLTEASVFP